ncbi:MAG: ATP-binding protein, partial [Bacteroidia bacterium]
SKFIEITGFTEQELSFGKTIQINDTKSQSEPFSLTKIGGDACWEGDLEVDFGTGAYETFYMLVSRIHHPIAHPQTKFVCVFLHPDVKSNTELSFEPYFGLEGPLLCIANLDGYFVKVSQSFIQLLGYDETEFTSIPFYRFVHPDDVSKMVEVLFFGSRQKNFLAATNRYHKKNGTYITLKWHAEINPHNNLIYAFAEPVNFIEASNHKPIKSEAPANNGLIALISHEIRNPLNAIAGYADLMEEGILDHSQRKRIGIIRHSIKSLNLLLNDILDTSKLQNGKFLLVNKTFNLVAAAKETIELFEAKAQTKKVSLVFKSETLPNHWFVGDETRIKQMLNNLISNALKFTSKGFIEVQLFEKERMEHSSTILISVKDTGIGIDPSKTEAIFQPFIQSDAATAIQFGGTGLGLSIVKMLVDLHGGKIYVQSELQKGSEFRIELPLANAVKAEAPENYLPNEPLPKLTHKRILVVDDNEHNRFLSETFLTRNGASVTSCSSAKKALRLLQKGILFDLILMDVQMPIMSGIEASEYIRNTLSLDLPIVACSAHVLESEKALCFEAGMNAYLVKPYSEAQLISSVTEVLKPHPSVLEDSDNGDDFNAIFNEHKSNLGEEATRRLVELMTQRITRDVPSLKSAIAENQCIIVAQLCHGLAGSMAGMNFNEGLFIARKLEYAAKENNRDNIIIWFDRLQNYFDRFDQFVLGGF